jgi:hypothetical protein
MKQTNINQPDYHFKRRLAFGILNEVGEEELDEFQKEIMIDVSVEYEFIKNKTSSLSRVQRDQIEQAYVGIQNTLANKAKADIKSKEEEE